MTPTPTSNHAAIWPVAPSRQTPAVQAEVAAASAASAKLVAENDRQAARDFAAGGGEPLTPGY
jgi:hypothetical protein